jgi:hypothetical protein
MKKLVFVLVLVMSVMAVRAQVNKTPGASESKSTVTTPASAVKVADLPKAITDNIAKEYPGYTVKEASSVTGKNGLNYQVVIMKGTETEALLYDKDGSFLKKLSGKPGMNHDMKDMKKN